MLQYFAPSSSEVGLLSQAAMHPLPSVMPRFFPSDYYYMSRMPPVPTTANVSILLR